MALDALQDRLRAAEDAISVWFGVSDHRPELQSLRDELGDLSNAIEESRGVVSDLESRRGGSAGSSRGGSEAGLSGREAAIVAKEEQLCALREELDAEREDLDRVRRAHEQEVLETQIVTGGGGEADQLRAILRSVREQLREAEAAVLSKARLLEKKGGELGAVREQLAAQQEENAQLEGEVVRVTKQAARKAEQAKDMLSRLQAELQAARQREAKAHEMLTAESRKQRVLQLALQKELSSRPESERSGRMPPIHASASADGGIGDVARTLQRNQALINELTQRRFENERLRSDNAHLILAAKDAGGDNHVLKNQVVASQVDRAELMARLRRAETEAKRWQEQLGKVSLTTIRRHREERTARIEREWERIDEIRLDARSRTQVGSSAQSRNIPVHKWTSMNQPELI